MVTKQGPAQETGTERAGTEQRAASWRALSRPRFLLVVATILLGASLALPYWSLRLHAPQYPGGLVATIYPRKLGGDIREIDGLNHYIGMMKLSNAAAFERRLTLVAVAAIALLGLLAAALRPRWTALLALPIVAFPVVFVGDLFYWLYRFGHDLNPHAALSSSIHPFMPHLLGVGKVGQFSTTARFEFGYYLACLAAVLALMGIIGRLRRQPM